MHGPAVHRMDERRVRRSQLGRVLDVAFGDHEEVQSGGRVDVVECEQRVALVDGASGRLTAQDACERIVPVGVVAQTATLARAEAVSQAGCCY